MTTIKSTLKPFALNSSDIQFMLDQVNFTPLFDAAGDVIISWDGTSEVYNRNQEQLTIVSAGQLYLYDPNIVGHLGTLLATPQDAIDALGSSYQLVTDLSGLRDPSGHNNNLSPVHAHWGEAGYIFPRMVTSNYGGYSQEVIGGAPTTNIDTTTITGAAVHTTTDAASSFASGSNSTTNAGISTTVAYALYTGTDKVSTTDSVTTVTTVDGHHTTVNNVTTAVDETVTTSSFDYIKNVTTTTVVPVSGPTVNASSTTYSPISGTTVLTGPTTNLSTTSALTGGELDTTTSMYFAADGQNHAAHNFHGVTNGVTGAADYTSPLNPALQNVVDYTPRMISLTTTTAGVTYDTWANHQTDHGAVSHHGDNEIYYGTGNTGLATVLDWGQLATVADGGLGQVDPQARLLASAGQDDHFIGGLNPGVSPSNGFFVLFGQFFDHGLDFINKGGNGTIQIALGVDDPLYGMMGPDGKPVTTITINRAVVDSVDAKGPEYINHTSPYIDQSQTYGSHEQLTTLLREWVPDAANGGAFHAGMKLFDGQTLTQGWMAADGVTLRHDTLPTLNELRAHIVATGRDDISWEDVSNLRNRDAGGHVSTGNSGSALILDMNPRFDTGHLHNGDVAQDAVVDAAIATLAADALTFGATLQINGSGVLELTGFGPAPLTGANALYPWVNFADFSIMQTHNVIGGGLTQAQHDAVGSILMAAVGDHYIAGDGRVNENFGLTSIHHVFHEEHNYQVQNFTDALYREDAAAVMNGDASHTRLHGFQIDTGHGTDGQGNFVNATGDITWDLDKMFNAAKLIVEMEYQHAAVDQYARNVTPNIQEFVGYSPDKDPSVTLEYAQGAFRFGHSTLRETIDTIDPTHGITGKIMGYALRDAFLNPDKYADIGPSAILLGMSHQQMNEVDEFITPALNQGLLGQPLDLAAINIARGRDIGLPTLNDFRQGLGLARYTSWNDFGQNMQHPSSLVNFIAAYSFDGDMAKAAAIIGLADGSITAGSAAAQGYTLAQANAFLTGDEAIGGAGTLGFNHIDTWLGGLAEIHQPGGLLGETFDLVFVTQIEALMDGDRFYYLFRLAGQQFAEEVGGGQLKDIVERNTGLDHLNGNIFGYSDQYVDLGAKKEVLVGTQTEYQTTGNEHKYGDIAGVDAGTIGVYSNGGLNNANDGNTVTIGGVAYIQDTRLADSNPLSAYNLNGGVNLDGTPNSGAESNEVIVGTKGNDLIYAQGGDDTVYGEDGNDTIYGGYGIDRTYGGAGSDKMYGGDNPDLMDGGSGDDFIYGESSGSDINGNDQVIGGSGNDFVSGGVGIDKLSGGTGDDIIHGDQDTDPFTHGSDGNDAVYGDSGGDILYGDNGDDLLSGGADQDQLFGNSGDDIMLPGDPTGALTIGGDEILGNDGVDVNDTGFDLMDYSDNSLRPNGVTFDLGNQINPAVAPNGNATQTQSFQMDGTVGSVGNDTLTGSDTTDAGNGADASIAGHNWLIGGGGNDKLTGGSGFDVIVGGSIRLDTLIGSYNSGYTHNNNNSGLTDADQLQDALYQGASHRVLWNEYLTDNLGTHAGLLDNAALGTQEFDKHFTEMLRTEIFKDKMLGDGGDGTADIAVYHGNRADYLITQIKYDVSTHAAATVSSLAANVVTAYLIADQRDPGVVDVDGASIYDGKDLVIGVDKFQFVDGTIDAANLLNNLHTGTLSFRGTSGNIAFNTVAVLTPYADLYDLDNVAPGNPNGAVTIPTTSYQWNESLNGGVTWTAIAQGAAAGQQSPSHVLSQAQNTAGRLVQLTASYTDLKGNLETITESYNLIVGSTGNPGNTLTGADIAAVNRADAIFGLSGNDTLNGGLGNDKLYGGTGNDAINGGDGTDTAGFGNNSVLSATFTLAGAGLTAAVGGGFGGDGTDTLNSIEKVEFNDGTFNLVLGTIDADTAAGASALVGGADRDLVLGFDGDDELNGAGGNDVLDGGDGNDIIDGGAGSDIAVYAGGGFGGAGGATAAVFGLDVSGNVTITVDVPAPVPGDPNLTFTDTLINVEQLAFGSTVYNLKAGTNGVDTLTGDATANIMLGFDGVDTINGGAGNDIIRGGAGVDTIGGGAGSDTIFGDAGNDMITGGANNDTIDGGADFDTAIFAGTAASASFGTPGGGGGGGGAGITVQSGSDGTDTLTNVEALQFAGVTYGLTVGTNGNDPGLNGTAGLDIIFAMGGNDTLNGQGGNDFLIGGNGNDTYIVNNVGVTVVEAGGGGGGGGSGTDTVITSLTSYTLANNVENLTYDNGAAVDLAFNGTGNTSNNIITGGSASNTLSGLQGNDTLNGGGGADILNGGTGADTLIGGLGNDTFLYSATNESGAGNLDIINDFTAHSGVTRLDQINLSAIDANTNLGGGGPGGQTFLFSTVAAANSIWVTQSGANVIINGDVNGNTTADFQIQVNSHLITDFSALDFVL